MTRRLVLVTLLVLLPTATIGCDEESRVVPVRTTVESAPPPMDDAEWRAVIDDWYDNGLFEDQHACSAVRETADHVPSSGRNHSIHDDLEAYADLVCTRSGREGAPITLVHRFVHPLPYPGEVRYTVSLRHTGGSREVRWARFSSDDSYVRSGSYAGSGIVGVARFASLLLRSRRYVVTSSTSICADPNDGCLTMGKPQERCDRNVDVNGTTPITIDVVAQSTQVCRISIRR